MIANGMPRTRRRKRSRHCNLSVEGLRADMLDFESSEWERRSSLIFLGGIWFENSFRTFGNPSAASTQQPSHEVQAPKFSNALDFSMQVHSCSVWGWHTNPTRFAAVLV